MSPAGTYRPQGRSNAGATPSRSPKFLETLVFCWHKFWILKFWKSKHSEILNSEILKIYTFWNSKLSRSEPRPHSEFLLFPPECPPRQFWTSEIWIFHQNSEFWTSEKIPRNFRKTASPLFFFLWQITAFLDFENIWPKQEKCAHDVCHFFLCTSPSAGTKVKMSTNALPHNDLRTQCAQRFVHKNPADCVCAHRFVHNFKGCKNPQKC